MNPILLAADLELWNFLVNPRQSPYPRQAIEHERDRRIEENARVTAFKADTATLERHELAFRNGGSRYHTAVLYELARRKREGWS